MNKKMLILSYEYPAEAMMLRVLCLVVALLASLYLYFVAASVLNIIAQKQANVQSVALQGSIGTMEEQYFALSQMLTPSEASALGLSPVAQTNYVRVPGNAAAAALHQPSNVI